MARSEKAVVTVLCMVHDGTRLLLQNRVKADWRGYTLPGGHVEKGESFVQAVTREMREETGLTVHAPRLCGIKDWCEDGVRHVVLLYRAEQFTGTLRSSVEGEVWWAELAGLPRSILHLPTCSTFSACLKKMISTSCSTARTVKIGLTN